VVALAKAAAAHGGVYTSHMRDEGIHEIDAITEAVNVGKQAGMRVEISHLKIDRRSVWGASEKSLALIERFRDEGVDVVADQYPYDRAATNLGIRLPSWALADGKVKERLADPATRAKIAAEMRANLKEMGEPDYAFATVARYTPAPSYEGKTIAAIAESRGRAGLDGQIETIFEMMNAGGASMIYKLMGDEDIDRIMRWPNTAIASDGGVTQMGVGSPHPRSYGTNARVLARYVRERHVLTLEDAVRRMTSLPAHTFGLADRGILKPGMAADVVVFDPARVADEATFARPHQYSVGFDWVLVNGVVAVDGGKVTKARGGVAVRKR
jgi:N-acyl-D-amino-acid deacylase